MRQPSRPVLLAVAGVLALAAVLIASRGRDHDARYLTAVADRGDVVDVVGATGTAEAVTTVQVGSQVSGNIQSLYADFNSVVKKGQVIARLDPSLFEARVQQMRANLVTALANVEKAKATVEDARQKYDRNRELAAQSLVPTSDLETTKANYDGALAQVKADNAAVEQAKANLNQAELDLAHTVIAVPIDGVVIARNVDVGQTVAASFQAPVLFVVANDLTRMQVNASIDEADIGRVRVGQAVTFRVDAYPERTFEGRVQQIRLQPSTVQNVVTYSTIIAVENKEALLKPGMTATVSVVVNRSDDAVRIPVAALRFRPEGAAGGGHGPRPGRGGADGGPGAGSRRDASGGPSGGKMAVVYVVNDRGQAGPVRVALGISDGAYIEVRDGLAAGARVVTGIEGGSAAPRPTGSPSANPFVPQFQPRRR